MSDNVTVTQEGASILQRARAEGFREGLAQGGQVRSDEICDMHTDAMRAARKEWRGYWQFMIAAAFALGALLGSVLA